MSQKQILLEKIADRTARIGVIGMGYVGLPLAVEFAHSGFRATGFEVDTRKADAINNGQSYIIDVPSEQVAELVKSASGRATLRRGLETIAADSIDQLTRSLLGVPLDMDAIGIWTQGIGLKEDESSEQRFGNGDLWQVTVGRLQSRGVHRYASRLSAVKGDTVVRMVIDEWQAE